MTTNNAGRSNVITAQQWDALRSAVEARIEWCLARAEERGFRMDFPVVEYKAGTRSAGHAKRYENRIMVNSIFLVEQTEDMLKNTIPHEIAHLIAFKLFPKCQPHGFTWQSIMQDWFGLKADRCHYYPSQNVGRGKELQLDLNSLFAPKEDHK